MVVTQRANLWLEPFALRMQAIALIELDRVEAAQERAEAAVGLSRKRLARGDRAIQRGLLRRGVSIATGERGAQLLERGPTRRKARSLES